jgi:hypothetical protein
MNVDRIGETAGKIWHELGNRGQSSVRTLARRIGSDSATTQMAVGWLAREGKVAVDQKGTQIVVDLTTDERNRGSV